MEEFIKEKEDSYTVFFNEIHMLCVAKHFHLRHQILTDSAIKAYNIQKFIHSYAIPDRTTSWRNSFRKKKTASQMRFTCYV